MELALDAPRRRGHGWISAFTSGPAPAQRELNDIIDRRRRLEREAGAAARMVTAAQRSLRTAENSPRAAAGECALRLRYLDRAECAHRRCLEELVTLETAERRCRGALTGGAPTRTPARPRRSQGQLIGLTR